MASKPIDRKYKEFAVQIGEDPKDPFTLWHIEDGFKSGFPACCVAFHVLVWRRIADCIPEHLDQADVPDACWGEELCYPNLSWLCERCPPRGPGYIACPACALAANFVKVKRARRRRKPPRVA